MKKETPTHIQEAVDNVMALYDQYLSGTMDLKALDPMAVLDLERDFQLADRHLDYIKHQGLSTLRQSLFASLLED
jgi:hypothetical protein